MTSRLILHCALGALIALITLTAAATAAPPQPAPTPESRRATRVTAIDAAGYEASVVKAHRGRPLVVTFWTAGCAPCRRELPALLKWARTEKRAALALVALDVAPNADRLDELLAGWGPRARSFWLQRPDFEHAFERALDPSWEGAVPHTLVYDARGNLTASIAGEVSAETVAVAVANARSP